MKHHRNDTRANVCGHRPNQKRLGARRQPYALVEFDPRLRRAPLAA